MKNRIVPAFLLALLSACGKVPTPLSDQPIMHFVGDFETGNLNGFHFLVPDTSVNTTIVTDPVRKGTNALKNTLRPDDYINNGYRSELAIYNCAEYGTEVYYAFSFMIDTNYSNNEFNLICQWQDLPNYEQGESWEPDPNIRASSPPVALVYVNGNAELKMNENPMSENDTYLVGNPTPIVKGQWYDVITRVYWSDDQAGFLEMWINVNYVTPFNGTDFKFYRRNLFNRSGNYFKFGQYRGKNNTSATNTVYFDEVKIGSTYNEVAP